MNAIVEIEKSAESIHQFPVLARIDDGDIHSMRLCSQ
jgi:hypothetical protein